MCPKLEKMCPNLEKMCQNLKKCVQNLKKCVENLAFFPRRCDNHTQIRPGIKPEVEFDGRQTTIEQNFHLSWIGSG